MKASSAILLVALAGQTACNWMSVYDYEQGMVVFPSPTRYSLDDLTVRVAKGAYEVTIPKERLALDCSSKSFGPILNQCLLSINDLCVLPECILLANPLLVFQDAVEVKVKIGILNLVTDWRAWKIEVGGGWNAAPVTALALPPFTDPTYTHYVDMTKANVLCKVEVYEDGTNYAFGFRLTYCDQSNTEDATSVTMLGTDATLGLGNPSDSFSWTGDATAVEMYQDADGWTCGVKINNDKVLGCGPTDDYYAFTVSMDFPHDGRGLYGFSGTMETGGTKVMLAGIEYSLYRPTVTSWTPHETYIDANVRVFWSGTAGTVQQFSLEDGVWTEGTSAAIGTLTAGDVPYTLNKADGDTDVGTCTAIIINYDLNVDNRYSSQMSYYGDYEHDGYQMFTDDSARWSAGDPVQLGSTAAGTAATSAGPTFHAPADRCMPTSRDWTWVFQLQPASGISQNDWWMGVAVSDPEFEVTITHPIKTVKVIQDADTNGLGFVFIDKFDIEYVLGQGSPADDTETMTTYDCDTDDKPGSVFASMQLETRVAEGDLLYVFCQDSSNVLVPMMTLMLAMFIKLFA